MTTLSRLVDNLVVTLVKIHTQEYRNALQIGCIVVEITIVVSINDHLVLIDQKTCKQLSLNLQRPWPRIASDHQRNGAISRTL